MIVIEHGETYKIVRCSICRCKFSYTSKDIYTTSDGTVVSALLGKKPTWVQTNVDCPECGSQLKIKKEELL